LDDFDAEPIDQVLCDQHPKPPRQRIWVTDSSVHGLEFLCDYGWKRHIGCDIGRCTGPEQILLMCVPGITQQVDSAQICPCRVEDIIDHI
jgi:hypothetical protein